MKWIIITVFLLSVSYCWCQLDVNKTFQTASIFNKAEEYDSSLVYYKEVEEYFESGGAVDLKMQIETLKGIGIAYRYGLAKYESAIGYFNRAYKLLRTNFNDDHISLSKVTYHLATSYRRIQEYRKAREYAELTLNLAGEGADDLFIAKLQHGLGNILVTLEEYDDALLSYEKAITLRSSFKLESDEHLLSYWSHKAMTHHLAGDLENSIKCILEADKMIEKFENIDSTSLFMNYLLLAGYYCEVGDLSQSEHYYQKGRKYCDTPKNRKDPEYYSHFQQLGLISSCQGDFQKSIYYIDLALELYSGQTIKIDLNSMTFSIDSIYSKPPRFVENLFFILHDKASVLNKLYLREGRIDHLFREREIYRLVDSVMSIQKEREEELIPVLHLAEHANTVYNNALNNLYDLYVLTKDEDILNDAFKYFERNKHYTLLRKKILNQEIGDKIDQNAHLGFSRYYVDSLRLKMEFVDSFNTREILLELAEFYSNEFNIENIVGRRSIDKLPQLKSLPQLRKSLNPSSAIATYFDGEKYLFNLFITKDIVHFFRDSSSDLDIVLNKYNYYLRDPESVQDMSDLDSFVYYSYNLKNILFDDSLLNFGQDLQRDITIVPDGRLNNTSFSALVLDTFTMDNYVTLNYLIRTFEIKSTFSISNLEFDQKKKYLGRRLLALGDTSLSHSENEISKIFECWSDSKSKIMTGDHSEALLKNRLEEYDVLHLASHGYVGKNAIESYLSVGSANQTDDGRLYNYEIYSLPINAQLVTLSACDTGLGKEFSGEGVFSLARGFNYAGCPTVVMSYWKVSDVSTSRLMADLYSNISAGKSVSGSLRKAQLSYLENSNLKDAHPYYWSGISSIGNGNLMLEPSNRAVWPISMTLGLLCLILLIRSFWIF